MRYMGSLLPNQELNPHRTLEGEVLTTGSPGKSQSHLSEKYSVASSILPLRPAWTGWVILPGQPFSPILPYIFFFFFVALEWFVGSLFPDSELNLVPQRWKFGVLTTRPPRNSLPYSFIFFWVWTSPLFIGVLWSTRPCIVPRIQWWPTCELCGQRWSSYTGSFRSRLKS